MRKDQKDKYILKLYLVQGSEEGKNALHRIKELFAKSNVAFSLNIVDILANPDLAEEERIIAVPLTLRQQPLPPKRIIGDLSEEGAALILLDGVGNEKK